MYTIHNSWNDETLLQFGTIGVVHRGSNRGKKAVISREPVIVDYKYSSEMLIPQPNNNFTFNLSMNNRIIDHKIVSALEHCFYDSRVLNSESYYFK